MGSQTSDNELAEIDQQTGVQNTTPSFLDKLTQLWLEAKQIFLEGKDVPARGDTNSEIIEVPSRVRDQEEIEFIDSIVAALEEYENENVQTREEIYTDERLIGVADVYLPDEELIIVCGSTATLLSKVGIAFSFISGGYSTAVAIHNPTGIERTQMKILDEAGIDLIIPGEDEPGVVTEYSSFRTTYDEDDFETKSLLFWE